MAANRKLQGEIQQVLKKLEEGVEIFDEIWEKVYAAEQQSLKEKYESDLKKEIKKLQRLRDQIKTWLGSNDIKDKTQLTEARKIIESKMEQFKVCEKDTKTKAYSKEGLAREAKMDPKDVLKEEKRAWINDCLDKLTDQVDMVEAEREKFMGGKGKNKNKEVLEKFENRIQKHKWHMAKLELIIKLLESDDLDPSLLDGIADSLDYYIESAPEDDGAIGVEDEFDIYEELELDTLGAAVPSFDLSPRPPAKEEEAIPVPVPAPAPVAVSAAVVDDAKPPSAPKPEVAVKVAVPVAKVPVKAAVPVATTTPAKKVATPAGKSAQRADDDAPSMGSPQSKPAGAGALTPRSAAAFTDGTEADSGSVAPTPSILPSTGMSWATAASSNQQPASAPASSASAPAPAPPAPPAPTPAPPAPAAPHVPVAPSITVPVAPAPAQQASPPFSSAVGSLPRMTSPVVGPVGGSLPSPPPQLRPTAEMLSIMSQLKQSMAFTPESLEIEKQSSYSPQNFYSHTHPAFPTKPQFSKEADVAALLERLPMDTLFFVFYFQQGTYQQYLAAKQLKKHSWRFHKKYMTWFQRHEEPKIATDEYEEGTYVYFDYESGWCQRIKSEFKFEYAYLEDELGGGPGGGSNTGGGEA
ncbi:Not1 N-terminal domain, CCR4-Not complex component-domain-containing protein [Ochromonadaceae sp. CCMP2298]|nr:Not1 N-terminal domain, CCR4-Not complex component-domain-containing protein [Ochromonadaceae sp. CCMP2298]|mmetsp:Transcript_1030/g.2277  ORF Transcript_1030/g.2277 Transcript_1030/m.2277 type:complete len:637 (-) Transcript_1030:164-2074(-)|eukprot:CAMPEP_0173190612 /NCGR_PEP_ID=MMETSP1141-20130122/12438_1 /TAXON_ID=483371 /ORGANISM="non described non described, Strain CCMP2298" /LENGTH=636 /DNA_ID=CAMNT_0014114733 /DNA_START=47 /DNA_END=1957 /DNA_ORIENTATION=+